MAEHHLLDNLSKIVTQRKTFQKIMADGVVEEHEIAEQADLIQRLVNRLETELSDHDFELVSDLIAEIAVFHMISPLKSEDSQPRAEGELWLQQLAKGEK